MWKTKHKRKSPSRRDFLIAGVGGVASLAGCLGRNDRVSNSDPQSFNEIYKGDLSGSAPLSAVAIATIEEKDSFPETVREMKIQLFELREYKNNPETWPKLLTDERAVLHNQLDYALDEARIELRRNGGGGYYTVAWENRDSEWVKHLGWVGIEEYGGGLFAHNTTADTRIQKEYLSVLWDQEEITGGAATAIHTYRKGVAKAKTFETTVVTNEDPSAWLASMKPLDQANDQLVVNLDHGKTDKFGKIGYSRTASNKLVEIQDFDANETFTEEMELVENLTEFYYNNIRGFNDRYLHLDFAESEPGEDGEVMVEVDDGLFYATVSDWEQHKEDAYNVAIPDGFWPDYQYPGNVEPANG